MKDRGNKTILLIINVFFVTGIASYKMGISIFGATSTTFSIDPLLVPSMHARLTKAVNNCSSLKSIAQSIEKECPATHIISVERQADKCIHVRVKSENPYVCVGDTYVLLPSGALVKNDCFVSDAIKDLPIVALQKNTQTISDEFKQWLLGLDSEIIANYAISWIDDYEICLQDKHDKYKSIICTVNNTFDEKMRRVCQRIINEKNCAAQGTARNNFYSADIRFEKQIILCSQKGGAGNG